MKIDTILFGLLVAMCLVLVAVLVTPEPSGAAGIAHPDYPTMLRGGDGAARHQPVLLWGWLMGALQIVFCVATLAFGARSKRRFPFEERVLFVGAALYVGVFTWMVLSYRAFAAGGGSVLILSFPPPTALMLYGVGFTPVIFIVLYLLRFEPWILDDTELEAFLDKVGRGAEEG